MSERVTFDDTGEIDEIVAKCVDVHIERMDTDTLWLSLTRAGTNEEVLRGTLFARPRYLWRNVRICSMIHTNTIPEEESDE